mmetsp:Transcript_35674/g.40748  ORF Transcript_35674/g.40748 Transcript_35674/m.40748 type:complete len:107 (-) Transcript_35674:40-360(-)
MRMSCYYCRHRLLLLHRTKCKVEDKKRIEGNSSSTTTTPTKEEELTDHPVFVKNAEQVFCYRGLALFATDLAHALLLSVKVPLLACDLYDKMIVDIIQENDYESVD